MSVKVQDFVMESKKQQVEFLRWMTLPEIRKLITDLKKFLFSLKMKNKMRILKQTHYISRTRKSIARAYTILKEKLLSDEKYISQRSVKRRKAYLSKTRNEK